jgi:hypothetical protein
MNKRHFVSITGLLLVIVALYGFNMQDKNQLIGSWRWLHVMNTATNEKVSIEKLTMGMTNNIKTTFKDDNTYTEDKTKLDGSGVSTTTGEWKLEDNDKILSMKSNDKWRPSKVILFTADSLIVEMRPSLQLVMTKEK